MATDVPVIHAVPLGTHVYEVRSLETNERALVVSTPLKGRPGSIWSWISNGFVTIPTPNKSRFCRVDGCSKWRQWMCDGYCVSHFRAQNDAATP